MNISQLIRFILEKNIGDLASVIGVLIAIPGFIITVITIRRTKSAAESAKTAAEQAVKGLAKADTVFQIATALSFIDQICNMHRSQDWSSLPDKYTALRRSLISIKESSAARTEGHQIVLQSAISLTAQLEDQIERQLHNPHAQQVDIPKANKIMRRQADGLQRVLEEIKATIGGQD